MSNIDKLFKDWEEFDKALIKKYDGGYDNYTADEKYTLYLKMTMLIWALRKEANQKRGDKE